MQALNSTVLNATLPNSASESDPILLGDLDALTAGQSNAPLLAAQASAFGKAGKLQLTAASHRFPVLTAVKETVTPPSTHCISFLHVPGGLYHLRTGYDSRRISQIQHGSSQRPRANAGPADRCAHPDLPS